MQIYCITLYKWEGKSAFESPSCFFEGGENEFFLQICISRSK